MFKENGKTAPKADPLSRTPSKLSRKPVDAFDKSPSPSKNNKPKLASLGTSNLELTDKSQEQPLLRKSVDGNLRALNPSAYKNPSRSRPQSGKSGSSLRSLSPLRNSLDSDSGSTLSHNGLSRENSFLKDVNAFNAKKTSSIYSNEENSYHESDHELSHGADTESREEFDEGALDFFNKKSKEEPLIPSPPEEKKKSGNRPNRGIALASLKQKSGHPDFEKKEDIINRSQILSAIPQTRLGKKARTAQDVKDQKGNEILTPTEKWDEESWQNELYKEALDTTNLSEVQHQLFQPKPENIQTLSRDGDKLSDDKITTTIEDDDMITEKVKDLAKELRTKEYGYIQKIEKNREQIDGQTKDILKLRGDERQLKKKIEKLTEECKRVTSVLKESDRQHSLEIDEKEKTHSEKLKEQKQKFLNEIQSIHTNHDKQLAAVDEVLEITVDEQVRLKFNKTEKTSRALADEYLAKNTILDKTIINLQRDAELKSKISEAKINKLNDLLSQKVSENTVVNDKNQEIGALVTEMSEKITSLSSELKSRKLADNQKKNASDNILKDQKILEDQLKKQAEEIAQKNAENLALHNELDQKETLVTKAQGDISLLKAKIAKTPKANPNAEKEEQEKNDLIKILKDQIEKMSSQMDKMSSKIEENAVKETAYNQKIVKAEAALNEAQDAIKKQSLKFLRSSSTASVANDQTIADLETTIQNKADLILSLELNSQKLTTNIASLEKAKGTLKTARDTLQAQLNTLKGEHVQSEKELENIITALQNLREECSTLDPEIKFEAELEVGNLVPAINEISDKITTTSHKIADQLQKAQKSLDKNNSQKEEWKKELVALQEYIETKLPENLNSSETLSGNNKSSRITEKLKEGNFSDAIKNLKLQLNTLAVQVKSKDDLNETADFKQAGNSAEIIEGIHSLALTVDKFQKPYKDRKPTSILEGITIDEETSPRELLSAINDSAATALKFNDKLHNKLNEKITTLETKKQQLKEEKQTLQQEKVNSKVEKEELESEKATLTTDLAMSQSKNTKLTTELAASKRANQSLGQQLSTSSLPVIASASARQKPITFGNDRLNETDVLVLKLLTAQTGISLGADSSPSVSDILTTSDLLQTSVLVKRMQSNFQQGKGGPFFTSKNVTAVLDKLQKAIPKDASGSLKPDSFAAIVAELKINEITAGSDHRATTPPGNRPSHRSGRSGRRPPSSNPLVSQSAGPKVVGP